MSGRKNINNYQVALNQSLSANFFSKPTVISYLDNISYQIDVTTTDSQGTFAVQGSDNYNQAEPSQAIENNGTWVNLDLTGVLNGGIPTVNAANTIIGIAMQQVEFTALRIAYTSTVAGTGTCNIQINCKEIG